MDINELKYKFIMLNTLQFIEIYRSIFTIIMLERL